MRRELGWFGVAGAIAFAVDVGILYLVKPTLGLYWGRGVSFFCAVLVTWLLNRNITFKYRSSRSSAFWEFSQYLLVMLGGGSVNYLVYAGLLQISEAIEREPVWGVAAGSIAGLLFNFSFARFLIFKQPESN